ncbi:MAG: hypothetical protein V3S69_05875 [Dehalococcoidales bacterium]
MNKKARIDADPQVSGEVTSEDIEEKILHILRIYPVISPTMLQGGLGPYMKPAVWRPVLQRLISDGKVVETQDSMQTPSQRYNTYSKLSLPGTTVSVPST